MVRAVGFASQVAAEGKRGKEPASVFHLLGMDVFSGLDPAAREIAETRLFAERALFVAQRMPTLLRWQMELFSYELSATPEVKQALDNAERLTRSVEASLEAFWNEELFLDDTDLEGGKFDKTYPGVNWWATRRWKLGFGWGHTWLDRFGKTGVTDSFMTRIQWVY